MRHDINIAHMKIDFNSLYSMGFFVFVFIFVQCPMWAMFLWH